MRAGFLVNEVVTGLRRNITMTIAMILTTAISIGLFGGGLLVVRLADQSRNIYLDRVESQVFLNNDVSANDPTCDADPCKALRSTIESRSWVIWLRSATTAATDRSCRASIGASRRASAATAIRASRTSPMA